MNSGAASCSPLTSQYLRGPSIQSADNLRRKETHVPVHGEGNGTPLQYSCLENHVVRGAWWAAVQRGAQNRTWLKRLSMHACIGEGNGNPPQCSCLENPRDGGAWWADIYGVTQSRTRLKRFSSSGSSPNPAPKILQEVGFWVIFHCMLTGWPFMIFLWMSTWSACMISVRAAGTREVVIISLLNFSFLLLFI